MFSIFSTEFNQSSACSGSGELVKVGGLWLMNSRRLSRGGTSGGGGGSGACCCCTLHPWCISCRSCRICVCISTIVSAICCIVYIWAATARSVLAGGGFGGFISSSCCCCLSTLRLCRLWGRSIPPPFLVLTI
jgi:hypothetical protein